MYQYKINFMKKLKSKGNTAQQRFATLLHKAKKTRYLLKLTTWRGSQIVASYIVGRSGIKKSTRFNLQGFWTGGTQEGNS